MGMEMFNLEFKRLSRHSAAGHGAVGAQRFELLPIQRHHAIQAGGYRQAHRDPLIGCWPLRPSWRGSAW
jgi:PIN domain nuclease of toxin-antitoxin system